LQSVHGYKTLSVHVTGTGVRSVPDGFVSGFRVSGKQVTLDLARNAITKLPPQLLYGNASSDWESIGTNVLLGAQQAG
jgi:hypothetical protein